MSGDHIVIACLWLGVLGWIVGLFAIGMALRRLGQFDIPRSPPPLHEGAIRGQIKPLRGDGRRPTRPPPPPRI